MLLNISMCFNPSNHFAVDLKISSQVSLPESRGAGLLKSSSQRITGIEDVKQMVYRSYKFDYSSNWTYSLMNKILIFTSLDKNLIM